MTCNADEYKGGIGNARCYEKIGDCGANKEKDAGLCYDQCPVGFKGVGPGCWAACPSSLPYSCGLTCVGSADKCGAVVGDQLSSVLQLAINIALLAKGRAAKKLAILSPKEDKASETLTAAQIDDNYTKMVDAFNKVKQLSAVTKVLGNSSAELESFTASKAQPTQADKIRIASNIAAVLGALDKTGVVSGVSGTVSSFSFPLCSTQPND